MPERFLAILSHSPSDAVCCPSIQASQASREANGTIGRSGLAVMGSPFDTRHRCTTTSRKISRERLILHSVLALRDHTESLRSFALTPSRIRLRRQPGCSWVSALDLDVYRGDSGVI